MSALTDELKLGEDNSDPIKVHPEQRFLTATVCLRDRDRNFSREPAYAPNDPGFYFPGNTWNCFPIRDSWCIF